MPERTDERGRGRWNPEEARERARANAPEEDRNFEAQVSDINTDPDAGFDFALNPTDEKDRRESER